MGLEQRDLAVLRGQLLFALQIVARDRHVLAARRLLLPRSQRSGQRCHGGRRRSRRHFCGSRPVVLSEAAQQIAEATVCQSQCGTADAKAQRKAAQEALDKKIAAKYPTLTEAQIKTLVVDDRWMAYLAAAVQGELDRVSQTLTGRIRELAERYATPLPQLTVEVAALATRVDAHLKRMGATWN